MRKLTNYNCFFMQLQAICNCADVTTGLVVSHSQTQPTMKEGCGQSTVVALVKSVNTYIVKLIV